MFRVTSRERHVVLKTLERVSERKRIRRRCWSKLVPEQSLDYALTRCNAVKEITSIASTNAINAEGLLRAISSAKMRVHFLKNSRISLESRDAPVTTRYSRQERDRYRDLFKS